MNTKEIVEEEFEKGISKFDNISKIIRIDKGSILNFGVKVAERTKQEIFDWLEEVAHISKEHGRITLSLKKYKDFKKKIEGLK